MFNNLIESQSHRTEFKRRGRFLAVTAAVYTLLFFAAGIGSIYAYDATLEAQSDDLMVLNWVPPVAVTPASAPRPVQPIRRSSTPLARVDPKATISQRTVAVANTNNPNLVPTNVGTIASQIPPVTGAFRIGPQNVDPPGAGTPGGCATCNGSNPVNVELVDTPPVAVKPPTPTTRTLTSTLLLSKVLSMPKPAYPAMAKQIHVQGQVNVQILVDEQGKVISAHAVNGHPLLLGAASQAALQARFTPTVLNGQPTKVQGVITYNFVLQ